jgi:hypothetical protein
MPAFEEYGPRRLQETHFFSKSREGMKRFVRTGKEKRRPLLAPFGRHDSVSGRSSRIKVRTIHKML